MGNHLSDCALCGWGMGDRWQVSRGPRRNQFGKTASSDPRAPPCPFSGGFMPARVRGKVFSVPYGCARRVLVFVRAPHLSPTQNQTVSPSECFFSRPWLHLCADAVQLCPRPPHTPGPLHPLTRSTTQPSSPPHPVVPNHGASKLRIPKILQMAHFHHMGILGLEVTWANSQGSETYRGGGDIQIGNFPCLGVLEPPAPSNGRVSVWAVSRRGQLRAEMRRKIDGPKKRT